MRDHQLWQPSEPPWLLEGRADETRFLLALRDPDPDPMTVASDTSPAVRYPVQDIPSVHYIAQPGHHLAAALIAARSEIAAIAKDSLNPHFKSKYASLDATIEEVIPKLNAHGLTVVQGVVAPDRDEAGRVTAFTVRTTLLHVSGESLTSDVVMPLAKSDPQGAGGALTYGRRYGLSALLCLATDEDDDGNAASKATKAQRAATAKTATTEPRKRAEDMLLPFGKQYKDKPLGDIPTEALASALKWAQDTAPDRFKQSIHHMETVLENRRLAAEDEAPLMSERERRAAQEHRDMTRAILEDDR